MKQFCETLESRRLMADISVALVSTTLASSLTAGNDIKPTAKASFTVAASGEALTKVQAKAKLLLTVNLHPASGPDIFLGSAKVPASALAKGSKGVNITFSKLKVAPAPGSYTVTATLSGQAAAGDTNAENDSASSSPITVTAPVSPFGTTLGNKITFKVTRTQKAPAVAGFRSQTMQNGTWSDNAGHSGTFFYTSGGNDSADGAMALTGNANAGLKFMNLKAGKDAPKIASTTYVFGGNATFATVNFAGNIINVSKGK